MEQIKKILARIDGRGYPAYKELRGSYEFGTFQLHIDHVQGDPFAAPSRVRVTVPQSTAQFPAETFSNRSRCIGVACWLARRFGHECRTHAQRLGSGKSGAVQIDAPGQEVMDVTAVRFSQEGVECRFTIGLPAAGRRILGREAERLLLETVPALVRQGLLYASLEGEQVLKAAQVNEDADRLRQLMVERGLVAFVADGSVLPRQSGVDPRPMSGASRPVPFKSPPELRTTFQLPNAGEVAGMGIPAGVTLIVGGGFHGKSTLLRAIELGIYNHCPNDGRELVVSHPDTVKVRAEDGRSVAGVDIAPFIGELPGGRATDSFETENASGSTSQAANIMEALELGARVLLIDEDTAATNFMIRDRRMQELIGKAKEPITPFLDKVRPLLAEHGVSTILVVGGSGDYFEVADRVVAMEEYRPREVTQTAKEVAERFPSMRRAEAGETFGGVLARVIDGSRLDPSKGKRASRIRTRGLHTVSYGEASIDLDAVEQIVDASQTRALADAMEYARVHYLREGRSLREACERVAQDIEEQGLDVLSEWVAGDYAAFRKYELGAAINRLRTLAGG